MRLRTLVGLLAAFSISHSAFAAPIASASLTVSDPTNYLDAGTGNTRSLGNSQFSFITWDHSGDSKIEEISITANDLTDANVDWFVDINSTETLKVGNFDLAENKVFLNVQVFKDGSSHSCSPDSGTVQISSLVQDPALPFLFSAQWNVRCGFNLVPLTGGVSIGEGVSDTDPNGGGGGTNVPPSPPVTAGSFIEHPLSIPPPLAGPPAPPLPPPATLTLFLPLELSDGPVHLSTDATAEVMTTTLATSVGFPAGTQLTVRTEPEGLEAWFPEPKLGALGIATSKLMLRSTSTTAGLYKVFVTAKASEDVSASAQFLVNVFCDPPTILAIDQPQPVTVAQGGSASWTIKPSGSGPLSYQWYQGSTGQTNFPIEGATSAKLTTGPLANSSLYWVRISNACGSVDSHTASANVPGH